MTIIKRCEKEVEGSWTDKRERAKRWLSRFVPQYCNECTDGDDCPAKHVPRDQQPVHRLRRGDVGRRWLDRSDPVDTRVIALVQALIDRMKEDIELYIHGYNTCAVERANSERTVYTSKRVEMYRNWRGKCKLVQLLHNDGATCTAASIRELLGWEVKEEVREHWRKIDRDKAKHREIKSDPSYNRRKRQLDEARITRSVQATTVTMARTKEKQKEKTRKAKEHRYHAKKQLLYTNVGRDSAAVQGTIEVTSTPKKPRKRRRAVADKENDASEANRNTSTMTADDASQEVDDIMSEFSLHI